MMHSTKPPMTLRSREAAASAAQSERPRMPAAFSACPESRRIMEEMIFNDRFSEEFEGKTVMVGLDEATAIRASNVFPFIGTSSLTSCVGIAVYDPDAKVGAVAHIKLTATSQDFAHVARMIAQAIETANVVGGRNYVLYSFNGRNGSRDWNDQLAGFLEREAVTLIASGTVSRFEQREEHNFVLDARTGNIFTAKMD
ncbi:MAG: hypothetical protein V1861_02610 [Candidatus Micrarchaeota archaeon]